MKVELTQEEWDTVKAFIEKGAFAISSNLQGQEGMLEQATQVMSTASTLRIKITEQLQLNRQENVNKED